MDEIIEIFRIFVRNGYNSYTMTEFFLFYLLFNDNLKLFEFKVFWING